MDIKKEIQSLKNKEIVTRRELQLLCCEIPKENVLLEWATRTGKSLGGLNCVKQGEKVLIVSPTHLINENWKKIIKDNFPNLDYKVTCYNSLHKELDEYDVVILDEVHKLSENRLETVKDWNCRWIGLSGTLPYNEKLRWIKLVKNNYFPWEIKLQQVIDWKILAVPQIVCVGLELKNDKRYLIYEKSKDKSKKNEVVIYGHHWDSIWNRDVNTHIQCSEKEWNLLVEEDIARWKKLLDDTLCSVPKTTIWSMIKMYGNRRQKMFSELKNKFIKKTVTYFGLDDKRVVIFCNDIPQTEWLDKRYAIHSKKKGSDQLLEDFNEGIIDKIIAVNKLNEGVDLYNVDAGILVQVGSSKIESAQKAARTLISDFPLLIVLYYKGCRDEEFVKVFTKQFKKDYVKWITPRESS